MIVSHFISTMSQGSKKLVVKVEVDEPAVDHGFDFVNYPYLSSDEQIRTIPQIFMQDIELPYEVKTRSHPCTVYKRPSNHGGGWRCDKIKHASKCLSGITGFHQAKGIECWRCDHCDWDLCIKCMKADKFIEMIANRED